jgi:hypothetical protein
MADNKLQHYVPKCHLRPFGHGDELRSINLYNLGSSQFIRGASLKGQCASDYFYGEDGMVERALQHWEGRYSTVLRSLAVDPHAATIDDLSLLREFALLQTFRTRGHVTRLTELVRRQREDILAASEGRRLDIMKELPIRQAVDMSIGHFLKSRASVTDLDSCLIVNGTRKQLVTSDDPAVLTNRYFLQRLREESSGLISAGAILYLPLSPRLAFLAFDGDIYYAPDREGNVISVNKADAISELNEMQVLNSKHNIYYGDPRAEAQVAEEMERFAQRRRTEVVHIQYFRLTGIKNEVEHYEPMDALEIRPGGEWITSFNFLQVHPSRWTRLLNFRLRPRFVDTGTRVGHIRPRVVVPGRHRKKVDRPIILGKKPRL